MQTGFINHKTSLWQTYETLQEQGANLAMRKVNHRREIYPGFPRAVPSARRGGRSKGRHERDRARQLLFQGADWDFGTIQRIHDAVEKIGVGEMGLDVYPNQIEVITAEQMLDAYASIGMPLFYKHWSFGKRFALHEASYRQGLHGAWPTRSSSTRTHASPTSWRRTRRRCRRS